MMKLSCGGRGLSKEGGEIELYYQSKARKLKMKEFERAQQKLVVSHVNYVESLKRVGNALFSFHSAADDVNLEGIMKKVGILFYKAARYGDNHLEKLRNIHDFTVEQLYNWEKKLYHQVKSENEKKEATFTEITKLMDTDLYCELLQHVEGLSCMWNGMFECHQEQAQIVHNQLITYTATQFVSSSSSSSITQFVTLELEQSIDKWMHCFCSLMASQRLHLASLTEWLRLIRYDYPNNKIYSLCEDWTHAINWIPDNVVRQDINNLLTTVRAIRLQQHKELNQNKRCAFVLNKLEKERIKLENMEWKLTVLHMHQYSSAVQRKRAKVAALMAKANEEMRKQHHHLNLTTTITLTNLLLSELPRTIKSLHAFTGVCMHTTSQLVSKSRPLQQRS